MAGCENPGSFVEKVKAIFDFVAINPNLVTDENYVHTDNNYTDEEKVKVSKSQKNVQSDFAQTNDSADDFIKNKVNIVVDENYIHTDNNYSNEEKEKLEGLHSGEITDDHYRGTYTSLLLANEGVVDPIDGDFVLITPYGYDYGKYPSYYSPSHGAFVPGVAHLLGLNEYDGAQRQSLGVLVDSDMGGSYNPTPDFGRYTSFTCRDINQNLHIEAPEHRVISSEEIQTGIFYINQNNVGGHEISWDETYSFTAAYTPDLSPNAVNRYLYESWRGSIYLTYAGSI